MSPGPDMPASCSALDAGWRMAAAGLAWLAGIGLQMQQPVLWPAAHDLALGLAALLLGLVWRYLARRTQGSGRAGLPVPGTLPGGFLQHRLAQVLPAELEGVDLQLTGVIVGLPQPGPQGTRFVLRVEQARRDGQPVSVPERVSLGWYRGFDGDGLIAAPVQTLRAGQRWLLNVRLRQPRGTLNLGGFDLEL